MEDKKPATDDDVEVAKTWYLIGDRIYESEKKVRLCDLPKKVSKDNVEPAEFPPQSTLPSVETLAYLHTSEGIQEMREMHQAVEHAKLVYAMQGLGFYDDVDSASDSDRSNVSGWWK